jgi:hypothetical protein
MRFHLRSLLILMAALQVGASIVAAGNRLTPMAMVGCYAILLLLVVGALGQPAESSQPLYRMIAILTVGLAAAAILVQLVIGL